MLRPYPNTVTGDRNTMPYDPERHHRRSIRLRGYDYASAGMYFVTICVQNRLCRLGRIADGRMSLSELGEIADRCWQGIPDHFPNAALDAHIIMPNHVHGIIVIGQPSVVGAQHAAPSGSAPSGSAPSGAAPRLVTPGSLSAIVRSFKAAVTREINTTHDAPGTSFWQRNYWEHVIRSADEHRRIYTYIISNPALWVKDRLYLPDEEVS